jgi:hypothetical protein
VWAFRRDWVREKERIKGELLSGNYRFSLLSRITLKDGDDTDLWSARDALVLKALALVLAKHLPDSSCCTHIKAHGGAKFAVREVRDHLAANRFVLRTDVKSYYASIDHLMLLDQLAVRIKDRRVLNLVGQYLRRTSERGGSCCCSAAVDTGVAAEVIGERARSYAQAQARMLTLGAFIGNWLLPRYYELFSTPAK